MKRLIIRQRTAPEGSVQGYRSVKELNTEAGANGPKAGVVNIR